jgi:hypothetical protein
VLLLHILAINNLKNPPPVATTTKTTPCYAPRVARRIVFSIAMNNAAVVSSINNTRTATCFQKTTSSAARK